MATTIRDMVKAFQIEIRDTAVTPDRTAELLAKLTALLGNVNEEIREADHAYAVVLLRCLDANEAANRARIRAETTPEYARRREARDIKELTIEMIRSLKVVLKTHQEEMRLTR
jgi:hypothetical protein